MQWAILLTGSARTAVEQSALEAGFDLCLRKPVSADVLMRAIARRGGLRESEPVELFLGTGSMRNRFAKGPA